MKSKIDSIPIGMLSRRWKDVVVTKSIWKMKNKAEAVTMNVLKALFLILYQKMNVKNEYSKNV